MHDPHHGLNRRQFVRLSAAGVGATALLDPKNERSMS